MGSVENGPAGELTRCYDLCVRASSKKVRGGTAELCGGSVGSACKGEVTFAAPPNAHADPVNSDEAATRAFMRFLELSYHFHIAFSNRGTVTGS